MFFFFFFFLITLEFDMKVILVFGVWTFDSSNYTREHCINL